MFFRGLTQWDFVTLASNIKNKQLFTNMKIKLSTLRCNGKIYKELIQWGFVPLGKTLTYTTENMKNLSKCIKSNQCIDVNR